VLMMLVAPNISPTGWESASGGKGKYLFLLNIE